MGTDRYSSGDARRIVKVTQRQLDYWDTIGLIRPSLAKAQGKGHPRWYSYRDLVRLGVVVALRKAGLPLQKVRRALKILRNWDPKSDSLAKRKLVTDGNDVFVTTSDSQVLKSVLKKGQLAFGIVLLGKIVEQTQKTISLSHQKGARRKNTIRRRRRVVS